MSEFRIFCIGFFLAYCLTVTLGLILGSPDTLKAIFGCMFIGSYAVGFWGHKKK